MTKAIILDESDNVATAMSDIPRGDRFAIGGRDVLATEDIPFGHKIALATIPLGQPVIKYGESIGLAGVDIAAGNCVHVHNVESQRGRGDRRGT